MYEKRSLLVLLPGPWFYRANKYVPGTQEHNTYFERHRDNRGRMPGLVWMLNTNELLLSPEP